MEEIDYSMEDAAKQLGITRKHLFNFLRRYNFLNGTVAAQEFVLNGYFIQTHKDLNRVGYNNTVNVVRVTEKGVKWLMKVIKLLRITIYE